MKEKSHNLRRKSKESLKRRIIGESRQLDNHFDEQLHPRSWITAGKTPDKKYNYGDSGLGVMTMKVGKMKEYKMKYELEEEVEEMLRAKEESQRQLRIFKEFESIKENQVIVTIEYCTNCQQHQSSTRHNQQKYIDMANTLKDLILQSFPIIKVFMKPLIIDHNDKSINQRFLQKRLGAFEVQVCARILNKYRCEVLFSKITKKKWPNMERDIINQLPSFLNQQSLIIQLIYDENDENDYNMENQQIDDKLNREKKFKKVQIILKPLRKNQVNNFQLLNSDQSQSQINIKTTLNTTINNFNKSRPVSGVQRPKSHKSNLSQNKTFNSINKQILNINNTQNNNNHQNNNHTFKNYNNNPLSETKIYISNSDANGRVYFNNLPEDNYIMEIQETNDFLPESRHINMFEMIQNNQPFFIKIQLQKQPLCFLNISLQYQQIFVNDAIVEILKENTKNENQNDLFMMENYKKQIKENPVRSGKYQIDLEPGLYRIIVNRKQFESVNQLFNLKSGSNDIILELKPMVENRSNNANIMQQQQQQSQCLNQRPQSGLLRNISESNNSYMDLNLQQQQQESKELIVEIYIYDGLNNDPLDNVNLKLVLIKQNNNEESIYKTNEQGKCQLTINNYQYYNLHVSKEGYHPIIENIYQNQSTNLLFFLPLIQQGLNSQNFIAIIQNLNQLQKTNLLLINNEEQDVARQLQNDDNIQLQNRQNSTLILVEDISQLQQNYRFLVKLSNLTHKLKIYAFLNNQLRQIEMSNSHQKQNGQFWDIGYLMSEQAQFVEINAISDKRISYSQYLKQYQELLSFIHNSKSVDIKTILGFNKKERIVEQDDVHIQINILFQSLDEYGFEFSQEQILHLVQSAIVNQKMFVSLNRLQLKIQHLKYFQFVQHNNNQEKDDEDEELIT